jgi:hypothetical protein
MKIAEIKKNKESWNNDVKNLMLLMKQQIPAIILDKEIINRINLVRCSRDLIFNLDCIQKTRITLCCKVDFRIKKGRISIFYPFFFMFSAFWIITFGCFNTIIILKLRSVHFFRY